MPDANDADRALILAWFADFQDCGIDIDAAAELDDAIAAHYQLPSGAYDIDRAANDLATYPPIAARIEELQAEKAETDG